MSNAAATKYTATIEGHTVARSSATMRYTHVVVAFSGGTWGAYGWSQSVEGARRTLATAGRRGFERVALLVVDGAVIAPATVHTVTARPEYLRQQIAACLESIRACRECLESGDMTAAKCAKAIAHSEAVIATHEAALAAV